MPKRTSPMPFNKKLVLNQYLLSLFGVTQFSELAVRANKPDCEGLNSDNVSHYCNAILGQADAKSQLDKDVFLGYDRNIVAHTKALQGKRPEPIRWKYFQYLALLFTEIYLDQYMNRREGFLIALNRHLDKFNQSVPRIECLPNFTEEDLRRVAFWSATGSGKTLIMHMNIKQFMHYLNHAGQMQKLNRTLLVTPNEGLSRQHLQEMQLSGIDASIFDKNGSIQFGIEGVEIIEITKLAEKDGEKTVAVDSFEDNNLVLIDEAHRGSSGDVWGRYRSKLAREGFAFEYSATLGQAAANNKGLAKQYAKSIIFDYSYRHFHGDGYGKDYRILNLPEADNNDTRELYLTACMLSFYQQKLLFEDKSTETARFNIENPLCVFVGSKVNAVRVQSGREVSDVVDILLFLARLTSSANRGAVIERIKKIKTDSASLVSASGRNVFANMFPFIVDSRKTAEKIYDDMLRSVFNAEVSASLHVDELKGADGEIALRLGNNETFGIINVGDASKLCKLCERHEELVVSSRSFTGSLFHSINDSDSMIHVLIGSKRFSEGWNSWRVSTLGMMNVGRSEGSQVIQLFGRGVRLRGLNKSLKRHSAFFESGVEQNDKLKVCETLNVFGVRANYMEQFKQYLEDEGVSTGDDIREIIVPVQVNLGEKKLKTIKMKKDLDFTKDGGKPLLDLNKDLYKKRFLLDYYPRLQSHIAQDLSVETSALTKHRAVFQPGQLSMLDYDALFFDLQRLKKERGWFNLCISKAKIRGILSDDGWYEILIPPEQFELDSFERVRLWQEIASSLLQNYCEKFYKVGKSAWEAPNRKYAYLTADDPNFIEQHQVYVNKDRADLIGQILGIGKQIRTSTPNENIPFGPHEAIIFDQHLYQPLFFAGSEDIRVKPVPLNLGEKTLIDLLKNYRHSHADLLEGKELYLLRNLSRGKGVGFFEAGNFYPDFIMWLLDGDTQYISFIDPKGILHLSPADPKIEFYKQIKEVEQEMGDDKVVLNSFIISVTPYQEVSKKWDKNWNEEDFDARNILFQRDAASVMKMFKKIMPTAST